MKIVKNILKLGKTLKPSVMLSLRQRDGTKSLRIALWGICLISSSLWIPSAQAKDLQGRLGLGYNAEFENLQMSGGVPAVSIKYGFTRDLATEVLFGISTASPTNSVSGLKFFKNIFYESNLNFYFMLGGALISGNGTSGSQFIGGFGIEFFIPGVDSLGFAMETGGSFSNTSGSFAFKTLGVSFLNAGMHFYF